MKSSFLLKPIAATLADQRNLSLRNGWVCVLDHATAVVLMLPKHTIAVPKHGIPPHVHTYEPHGCISLLSPDIAVSHLLSTTQIHCEKKLAGYDLGKFKQALFEDLT